ncbi:hypothetical protein GH714_027764 [Hevea brasiliensis]|uniref:A20-type domain-containing protein n=1 Tax=Hevea brasiliensis TaxID=3981 RepID=A0A6A6MIS6_HEVBR|nr:hypothetical protein GH714_027764 [Hevea brasiliensis]
MDHDETGCQAPPERPILCINNCGFFGSAATMNMCSKCHKDMLLKQEQAKLAASSAGNFVNGSSSNSVEQPVVVDTIDVQVNKVESNSISVQLSCASGWGRVLRQSQRTVQAGAALARNGFNLVPDSWFILKDTTTVDVLIDY